MNPLDCAQISLSAVTGTDRVLLEMTGAAGEQVRAALSPAHLSALHQQIHAVFMANRPAGAGPMPTRPGTAGAAAAGTGAPGPGAPGTDAAPKPERAA